MLQKNLYIAVIIFIFNTAYAGKENKNLIQKVDFNNVYSFFSTISSYFTHQAAHQKKIAPCPCAECKNAFFRSDCKIRIHEASTLEALHDAVKVSPLVHEILNYVSNDFYTWGLCSSSENPTGILQHINVINLESDHGLFSSHSTAWSKAYPIERCLFDESLSINFNNCMYKYTYERGLLIKHIALADHRGIRWQKEIITDDNPIEHTTNNGCLKVHIMPERSTQTMTISTFNKVNHATRIKAAISKI